MYLTIFFISNEDTEKDRQHKMEQKIQAIEKLQEMGFDSSLIHEAIAKTESLEIQDLLEYLGKFKIKDRPYCVDIKDIF